MVKISLSPVGHCSLRSPKYSFPIFQHIPQLLHHSHFHLQIKIFLECYLANLPKDTPHVKKCALSFKLSIVLVGNLSHGLSNKCIECNECCNVYNMSYMIVVHTTKKRQTTTKKVNNKIIKLNPTPITCYVAPNQCDYWETLNVRSPKKNKHNCNILIFVTFIHIYTLTQHKHL